MRCVHPVHGFRARGGGVSFSRAHSLGIPMTVRCGQCIGCRLYHSREWAIRMTHESQLHPTNCTLTLTYDDENLPENGSLDVADHQSFIKRLRKRHGDKSIRFFHCGEYGEGLRPHYHTVLFGYDFPDKEFAKSAKSGLPLFRSDELDLLWGKGIALIGSLTFESAQYVAKYATKSLNVSKHTSEATYKRYQERYNRVDPLTGEEIEVAPEYVTMSRRPGLGHGWFQKFWTDVYPTDYVVLSGRKMPAPRYYDKLLERYFPDVHAEVTKTRILERDRTNDSIERLAAMEECALARTNLHGER